MCFQFNKKSTDPFHLYLINGLESILLTGQTTVYYENPAKQIWGVFRNHPYVCMSICLVSTSPFSPFNGSE